MHNCISQFPRFIITKFNVTMYIVTLVLQPLDYFTSSLTEELAPRKICSSFSLIFFLSVFILFCQIILTLPELLRAYSIYSHPPQNLLHSFHHLSIGTGETFPNFRTFFAPSPCRLKPNLAHLQYPCKSVVPFRKTSLVMYTSLTRQTWFKKFLIANLKRGRGFQTRCLQKASYVHYSSVMYLIYWSSRTIESYLPNGALSTAVVTDQSNEMKI
jgi:hypothetical protein